MLACKNGNIVEMEVAKYYFHKVGLQHGFEILSLRNVIANRR